MIRFQNRGVFRLSLLIILITCLARVSIGTAAEVEKTYIEFVFDASFSMNEEAEKGKSRMDVAKEVMIDLIQNLEDRPGLQVGLRVYGSRNTKCDDSVLVQDFGPVDAVRDNILKTVRALKPRGKTPIAYSLEQAAQDFPSSDSRNIIVLITDGQESCGGDPCAVSYYLQSQGIIYKPYVVGFAMSAADEAKVSCIGTYYSAKDRKSLSEALGSIMRKVVQPSTLEIEAWAGGQNVTSQTVFEITDALGDTVGSGLRPKGDSLTRSLAEGVYTVK
ncbi:MAG: VWA domain-containing protein, partial [Firmicutes bacterium]|nr:VWA domain-containing protein [Bacillota bacterium]